MAWTRLQVNGAPPPPRWGHTAAVIGEKLIVFGGHNGSRMLNDLHVLDTSCMTWTQVIHSYLFSFLTITY